MKKKEIAFKKYLNIKKCSKCRKEIHWNQYYYLKGDKKICIVCFNIDKPSNYF